MFVGGGVEHDRTVGAKRHDGLPDADRLKAFERERPVERGPVVVRGRLQVEQLRHLDLVDEQDVGVFDQLGGQVCGERRIVEQHAHAGLMAHARARRHGLDRAFQAQAEHVGAGQFADFRFHVVHAHLRVRASGIDDRVFGRVVDGDHGQAARAVDMPHMRRVHAGGGEVPEQEVGIAVRADGAEHAHVGAEQRGGRGLIAGFAAGQQHERAADDRFAGFGQTCGGNRVVHVHGADHGDGAVHVFEELQRE